MVDFIQMVDRRIVVFEGFRDEKSYAVTSLHLLPALALSSQASGRDRDRKEACDDSTAPVRLCLKDGFPIYYGFPIHPLREAKLAAREGDYRLAGWIESYMIPIPADQQPKPQPYGITCRHLPNNAFRFLYYKTGDGIGADQMNGYRDQRNFMHVYNDVVLKSGHIPQSWECSVSGDQNGG